MRPLRNMPAIRWSSTLDNLRALNTFSKLSTYEADEFFGEGKDQEIDIRRQKK